MGNPPGTIIYNYIHSYQDANTSGYEYTVDADTKFLKIAGNHVGDLQYDERYNGCDNNNQSIDFSCSILRFKILH